MLLRKLVAMKVLLVQLLRTCHVPNPTAGILFPSCSVKVRSIASANSCSDVQAYRDTQYVAMFKVMLCKVS